ncbi:TPA_asm: ORFX protein [Camellia virus B]|uniref:ORFX protein n=1 Tax=Camellia virus B TaxID=3027336 RepID=A0AA48SFM0_9SECO|nr:TPA_asm: ORFX protein [Camellia virus B]
MIKALILSGLGLLIVGLCLTFMGLLLKVLPVILVSIPVLFLALFAIVFGVVITPVESGYMIGNVPVPGYLTPGARGNQAVPGRPIVQNAPVRRGMRA